MKTLWILVLKDLRRDLKRPWGILALMALPLMTAWLTAAVFGGQNETPNIVMHVALWDQDDDFFSGMIRSMSGRGETEQNLQFHLVDSEEKGVQMLEDRQASAFLILPKNMTADLIDGVTTTLTIYLNPAESVLPKIVMDGTELVALVLSEGSGQLRPELQQIRRLFQQNEFPNAWETAMLFYYGMQRAESLRTYLFPPIIRYHTVAADAYVRSLSPELISSTAKEQIP